MTLPIYPNQISIDQIRDEFGQTGQASLSQYYANGGIVPAGAIGFPGGVSTPIPASGPISISNFYGATANNVIVVATSSIYTVPVGITAITFLAIGGGGGGGATWNGGNYWPEAGGGGGAGSVLYVYRYPVTAGNVLSFNIGAGGAGGNGWIGTQGQSTGVFISPDMAAYITSGGTGTNIITSAGGGYGASYGNGGEPQQFGGHGGSGGGANPAWIQLAAGGAAIAGEGNDGLPGIRGGNAGPGGGIGGIGQTYDGGPGATFKLDKSYIQFGGGGGGGGPTVSYATHGGGGCPGAAQAGIAGSVLTGGGGGGGGNAVTTIAPLGGQGGSGAVYMWLNSPPHAGNFVACVRTSAPASNIAASSGITLNTDGTMSVYRVGNVSGTVTIGSNWYFTTTPGIGNSYWVRASYTSYITSAGTILPTSLNTWYNLSSAQTWFLTSDPNIIPENTTDYTIGMLTLEFSTSPTGSPIVATSQVELAANSDQYTYVQPPGGGA